MPFLQLSQRFLLLRCGCLSEGLRQKDYICGSGRRLHVRGVTSVLTCDIVYVEAKGRKVIVHTVTADLDSTQTLQFWIEHLPQATFFQSHRSYIVNMAMVTSFDHELIYLCDGQFTAYLTRRKFTEFKKAYLMFMESKR